MNTDPAVLYCMCVGGLISAGVCCLFGGPVFERSRGSRLRLLVLLQDCPSPQLLSAFPNSTTGVSCFCSLVGCKYLHLILSAACWVFWRAVMIGLFCEHSIASTRILSFKIKVSASEEIYNHSFLWVSLTVHRTPSH